MDITIGDVIEIADLVMKELPKKSRTKRTRKKVEANIIEFSGIYPDRDGLINVVKELSW